MKYKNKRVSRIIKLLLSIAVLAYSSLLQFSLPSIVLCFGDDGHIAFEQSGDNFTCDETEVSGDHPIHRHKNLSHQEEDCQDISLMTVLSNLYLEKDGKIKTVKVSTVLARINTKSTDLVSHFNQDNEAAIIHSSTKCLQTVILLI